MELPLGQLFWIVLLAAVTLILAATMGLFGGNQMPVEGKTILLTGASEGMGLSVAKKLAAKGAHIIIVSRSVPKLEEALKEIQASAKDPASQRFHYISTDVSAPSYAEAVVAEAIKWNNGKALDIVWCLAGFSVPQLFLDMEMSSMRQQMDVNFFGSAQMAQAILKEWLAPEAPVEKQPKHLIFTSSVVAFYTIPGYGPYAPSKFALRGLADTLALEVGLYPQNVKVHIVHPGTILSAGYDREMQTKPEITVAMEESDPKQSPDVVAEAAIQGLEKGQYYVVVSWLGHLMKWGMLGGVFRNNWIIDTLGVFLVQIVWIFVQMDMVGKVAGFKKKYGHPSTYKQRQA